MVTRINPSINVLSVVFVSPGSMIALADRKCKSGKVLTKPEKEIEYFCFGND
jgi:hypothetical protein